MGMRPLKKLFYVYLIVTLIYSPSVAQSTNYSKLYLKTGVIVEGIIEEVTSEAVRFNQTLNDGSHLIQNVPIIIIYKLISPSGEVIILNAGLRQDFEVNLARQGSVKPSEGNDPSSAEGTFEDNLIKLNIEQNVEYERRKLIVSFTGKNTNLNSRSWKSFQGTTEITETYFFSASGNKKDADLAFRHSLASSSYSKVGLITTSTGLIIYLFGIGKFIRDSFVNQGEEGEESSLLPKLGALITIGGAAIWLYSKIAEKPRWASYSYAKETADNYNNRLMQELLKLQAN